MRPGGENVGRGGAAPGVFRHEAVVGIGVFAVLQRADLVDDDLIDARVVVGQPEKAAVAPACAPGVLDEPRAVVRGAGGRFEVFAGEAVVPAHHGHGVVRGRLGGIVVGARDVARVPVVRVIGIVGVVAELRRAVFEDGALDAFLRDGIGLDFRHGKVAVEAAFVGEGLLHLPDEGRFAEALVQRIAALLRRARVVLDREADVEVVAAALHHVHEVRAGRAVVSRVGLALTIAVEGEPDELVFGEIDVAEGKEALLHGVGLHHRRGGVRPAGAADLGLHGRDEPEVPRVVGRGEGLPGAGVRLIGNVRLLFGRDLPAARVHPAGGRPAVGAGFSFHVIHARAVFGGVHDPGQFFVPGERPRDRGAFAFDQKGLLPGVRQKAPGVLPG